MAQFNLFIGVISWKSLLKKWIDWEVDFKKLLHLLQQVKKEDLMGFINGTYILAKPQKVMNYLAFLWTIKMQPVEKFKVGDFFKEEKFGMIRFNFNETFKLILEKIKDWELFLEKETELNMFYVKTHASKTEIESDFEQKPVIPVKKILPILKSLIEYPPNPNYYEKGLIMLFVNYFFVDFTEIDSELDVRCLGIMGQLDGSWTIHVFSKDDTKKVRLTLPNHFFSLAT